jgi:hypothetical protein
MRVSHVVASVAFVVLSTASSAQAQDRTPGPGTVAIGASVGFLAPDNGSEESALEAAAATVDAFLDYHYDAHVSIRGTYGWAQPAFAESTAGTLRRHHIAVSVSYGWSLGRFRPFASVGGGAYFLSRREGDRQVGDAVTKPGGLLGWGVEYYLRTFALRTEMNVHILGEEAKIPELGARTATVFTWVFGVKIPL